MSAQCYDRPQEAHKATRRSPADQPGRGGPARGQRAPAGRHAAPERDCGQPADDHEKAPEMSSSQTES
jgi:hypothetical protein